MSEIPSLEIIKVALEHCSSQEFENFGQRFMVATRGVNYVPLGGTHDGGADGILYSGLFEAVGRPNTFLQASIEQDPQAKISRTVTRLREFGRELHRLIYLTSQVVPRLDRVEEQLSGKLDIAIRIIDGNTIAVTVPDNQNVRHAYFEFLHHNAQFLQQFGKSQLIAPSRHIADPHVYTYLAGELNSTSQESTFVDGVVDALLVYGLEGTDPESGVLRSETEIVNRIVAALPSAQSLLNVRARDRLEAISAKNNRRISWHQKEDKWALRYEERRRLEEATAQKCGVAARSTQRTRC